MVWASLGFGSIGSGRHEEVWGGAEIFDVSLLGAVSSLSAWPLWISTIFSLVDKIFIGMIIDGMAYRPLVCFLFLSPLGSIDTHSFNHIGCQPH